MTPLELQKYLDTKVQYKNAVFKVSRGSHDDLIWIKMHVKVKDACSGYAYNQASEIPLTTTDSLPEWQLETIDEDELLYRVYYMIRRLELHEIDEHFKVNNKCYRDPHPDKKYA